MFPEYDLVRNFRQNFIQWQFIDYLCKTFTYSEFIPLRFNPSLHLYYSMKHRTV